MKIRFASLNDIEQISGLHQKNLISPIQKMGLVVLKNLYQPVLADQQLHICLLAQEDKRALGFITATIDLKRTSQILKSKQFPKLILAFLKAVLLNRVSIFELLNKFYFEQVLLNKFRQNYPTILTLAVDKNSRRRGIGKKLVKSAIAQFKLRKVKKIYVDTRSTNAAAFAFYHKLGFKLKYQIAGNFVLEYQIN